MRLLMSIALFPMLLIGCGTFSHDYSVDHNSYRDMIEKDFQENLWIPIERGEINPFTTGKARTPLEALNTYCQKDSGIIKQVMDDNDVSTSHKDVRRLTGLFQCVDAQTDIPLWMANIDARRHVGGLQKSAGYLFRLRNHDLNAFQQKVGITPQKAQAAKKAAELALKQFVSSSSISKNIGEKVCTWTNDYGVVDELSDAKLKINLLGTAQGQLKGYFFKGEKVKVNMSKQGKYVWDDSRNWAACDFPG